MEEIQQQIAFVSKNGHFVSPDLHLEIRKYFQGGDNENILDDAIEICTTILDPLLQQHEKPSLGSIELLDILRTLTVILDHKNQLPLISKQIFKSLMSQPWSVYAASALYTTTINLLSCDNVGINLSKAVSSASNINITK